MGLSEPSGRCSAANRATAASSAAHSRGNTRRAAAMASVMISRSEDSSESRRCAVDSGWAGKCRNHWSRLASRLTRNCSARPWSLSRCSSRRPTASLSASLSVPMPSNLASTARAASRYSSSASPVVSGWAPKRLARGMRRVISAHRASMVRMRMRLGDSSSPHPRSRSRPMTSRARRHVSALCGSLGARSNVADRRASTTRPRISAAALRVKVMATTSSGASARLSSASRRRISSSVFPDPAGAWTMNDRPVSSACRRTGSSAGRVLCPACEAPVFNASVILGLLRQRGGAVQFVDAAKGRQGAVTAGDLRIFGIHPRVARAKRVAQSVQHARPSADQRLG